jgi:beta-glucanase (GH16 family)
MRRRAVALVLALGATAGCASANGTAGRAPGPSNWTLAWSDDFDGPAGAAVDAARWRFDLGGGGWGNQELQTYTDRTRNAFLAGDGTLVIEAVREDFGYTSARLKTQGVFEQAYGRFEARLQLPRGQGLWPAFWMLGADIGTAGWPVCGEIDIMENIGREPSTVHGTLHGPGYSGGEAVGASFALPGGARFADDFHVFALEWEPAAMRWYVDGALYQTRTPADLPAGRRWAFDHPFFLILNVAVGGNWPGPPDGTTVFPQRMRVDYVKVFRR